MEMKVLGAAGRRVRSICELQGGRVLYQFTIRVKLPQEASGVRYGF